jgi:hypothetical protein
MTKLTYFLESFERPGIGWLKAGCTLVKEGL